jgi:hypothetical protein
VRALVHHTIAFFLAFDMKQTGQEVPTPLEVISGGWSNRGDDYVVRSTRCPPYTVALHHVFGTRYTLMKSRRDDVMPLAGGVNKAVSELSQHRLAPSSSHQSG